MGMTSLFCLQSFVHIATLGLKLLSPFKIEHPATLSFLYVASTAASLFEISSSLLNSAISFTTSSASSRVIFAIFFKTPEIPSVRLFLSPSFQFRAAFVIQAGYADKDSRSKSMEPLTAIAFLILCKGFVIAFIPSSSTKQVFLSSKKSALIMSLFSYIPNKGRLMAVPFLPFGNTSITPFVIFFAVTSVTMFSNNF